MVFGENFNQSLDSVDLPTALILGWQGLLVGDGFFGAEFLQCFSALSRETIDLNILNIQRLIKMACWNGISYMENALLLK